MTQKWPFTGSESPDWEKQKNVPRQLPEISANQF